MKMKSVKQIRQPNYPTLEYYTAHPELLYKSMPKSWIKNKYVATSLATFILLGSPKSKVLANLSPIEIVDKISSNEKGQTVAEKQDSIKIAPIFVHGKGTGATGCIVMSPPVFISEDEAKSIIFKALKAEGIKFGTIDCPEMKFTTAPIANDCFDDEDTTKLSKANVELKMDGYNKELNLAIQFVSANDYFKFRSDDGCWSSVQGYNTKKAAEIIRDELIANNETNVVVFYDPITRIDFKRNKSWEKSEKEARAEAEKLLLNQVNDFIKWLKQEKIIEK